MHARHTWIALALAIAAGCGPRSDRPDLGQVRGVVTLDGQPLANAVVMFSQPGFRTSSGLTDADGRYRLTYLRDITGAVVGQSTVAVRRFVAEGQTAPPLPPRYNSRSELTFEVRPGTNTADFALTSD